MQGKIINGFELKNPLGVGGMAEVWYAENEIHKAAAVKVLNDDLSRNASIVERFRNEAEIMVRLDHPNIREVYGYGVIDGRPAIVMEYLEGDDLKTRIKKGQRFTQEELVKWWNQLVDALKYTHEEGIVHRDIKPGNIFIDKKGNVKLLDFGIAKVRESISSTQTGQKLGTLMYMSPEQVRDSKHIDYHTDIYSLAVTFVHLITGKKPYDSDSSSDFDIQLNIVTKPLGMDGVPEEWKRFLAPYLEKEAEKRPDLRYFEASMPKNDNVEKKQVVDDEATIVEESRDNRVENGDNRVERGEKKPGKKRRIGLWICVAVIAIGAAVFMMIPKGSKQYNVTKKCIGIMEERISEVKTCEEIDEVVRATFFEFVDEMYQEFNDDEKMTKDEEEKIEEMDTELGWLIEAKKDALCKDDSLMKNHLLQGYGLRFRTNMKPLEGR